MNDWMPPLPEPDVIVHYTADQMRQAQADAARAALEQAARVCKAAENELWAVYKGKSDSDTARRGAGSQYVEGASDQCAVLADAIRTLAKEITP